MHLPSPAWSISRSHKADRSGLLIYRQTPRPLTWYVSATTRVRPFGPGIRGMAPGSRWRSVSKTLVDNERPRGERFLILGALGCLATHTSGTLLVHRDSRLEKVSPVSWCERFVLSVKLASIPGPSFIHCGERRRRHPRINLVPSLRAGTTGARGPEVSRRMQGPSSQLALGG